MSARIHSEGHIEQDYTKNHPFGMEGGLLHCFGLAHPGLYRVVGVVERYATIVNREAVGLDLLCFVQVMLAHHRPESVKAFPGRINHMAEVLECHFLTGEVDYLLKVVVGNHEGLQQFLFEKLMKVEGVDRIRTSIVVKEVKSTTSLPL